MDWSVCHLYILTLISFIDIKKDRTEGNNLSRMSDER